MKKFSSIMRVNSHRISQNKKRAKIVLVTVFCLLLLLVIPKAISSVVSLVAAPVNSSKTWFSESGNSLPQYLRNRSELIEEISQLRSEVAAARGDRSTVKFLAKENIELRGLMGYNGEERILAGIIGRPGVLPYDTLMLDQGSIDGVKLGAPIYVGENTVIGIVKNVTTYTSLVELITTSGFEATVYIIGPDIYTNAVGIGGGQLKVGVPQGIELSEGDMVVLPSVTSGVYGEISSIQSVPTRPEQYGFVSPKIPLASMRFVSVGTIPMQSISFDDAQEILGDIKTELFTVPVPENILVDTDISSTTASTTAEE